MSETFVLGLFHKSHQQDAIVSHIPNSGKEVAGEVLIGRNFAVLSCCHSNVSFVNSKSVTASMRHILSLHNKSLCH